MNFLDAVLSLLPVVAELDLSAHATLVAGKTLLVFSEAVERGNKTSIAHGCEACNAHVNADGSHRFRQRLLYFALCQDGHKPLPTRVDNSDIANFSHNIATVSIT